MMKETTKKSTREAIASEKMYSQIEISSLKIKILIGHANSVKCNIRNTYVLHRGCSTQPISSQAPAGVAPEGTY